MMSNINETRKALDWKREREKERRLEDIYDYLEMYPGQTAYSMSKVKLLSINKETIRLSLMELEKRGDINLVEETEKTGLKRKKAYVKSLREYYLTRFHEENLEKTTIRQLIEKARKAGYAITIIRKNETEVEVLPGEDLEEKLKQ